MALANLYELLPEGHADHPFYAGLLAEIAEGVAAWQQGDGLWMQIMDQPARAELIRQGETRMVPAP